MNRLETMRVFARVAELASFTRAADSLGLPKASASAAVQALEGALGARLLHRTTRRVELTQDGQVFYERCKDLLADIDELETLFQRSPAALQGRLRVDMPSRMAHQHVIPALPGFLQSHPGLELELSSTDRRVDLVREGFDCVLRVGPLGDSTLVARPLGRMPLANCASPEYLRRHGVPQRLDELASHRLVHYVTTLGARPAGWDCPDGTTLAMPGALVVNHTDAYEAACLAGLGLIQAPRLGLREHLAAGRLVEVLPGFPAPALPVALVYAHRRNLSRRVQVFMDWLAATLAPLLDPPG